jgi:hypothetical protein
MDTDAYIGVRVFEGFQDLRQQCIGNRHIAGEGDDAPLEFDGFVDVVQGPVKIFDDTVGLCQEFQPQLRDRARRPIQKRAAERGLELLAVSRKGGQGDVKLFGSKRKAIADGMAPGLKDWATNWWLSLRCSMIGSIIGALPGIGGSMAMLLVSLVLIGIEPGKDMIDNNMDKVYLMT